MEFDKDNRVNNVWVSRKEHHYCGHILKAPDPGLGLQILCRVTSHILEESYKDVGEGQGMLQPVLFLTLVWRERSEIRKLRGRHGF